MWSRSRDRCKICHAPDHISNQTFCTLERLQRVHENFHHDAAGYIRSQKIRLDRVVARPSVEDAKRRRNSLLGSDWLRFPRFIFQLAVNSTDNTTSQNLSAVDFQSEQFTEFLEAGHQLKAIERWTAAVDKRYTSYTPQYTGNTSLHDKRLCFYFPISPCFFSSQVN